MALLSRPLAATSSTTELILSSPLVKQVRPYVQNASRLAVSAVTQFNTLLNRYPPIKSFVYSIATASAIPIACFTGYSAATLGGVLAVAGTGAALVQAGFLAFGAFILSWFLVGALIFASIVTFWFTLAYAALQIGKRMETSF